jgi:hypothetical protein
MPLSIDDHQALVELEVRLRTILPEEYQDSYEALQPEPMRSAGLKYDDDGKVAWNQIWQSFCDLAMAGGPPHKGALLEPGRQPDIAAEPDRYQAAAEEICRGIMMAALLDAEPSPVAGWVRVTCLSETMARWLIRAITMENVAVRAEGLLLDLPAAPHFRIDREIKNVVTVITKTSHYWLEHMPRSQQRAIASLLARMDAESPLIVPELTADGSRSASASDLSARIAAAVQRDSALAPSTRSYAGWCGVECPSVRSAVWMMRALVGFNVLSRREGTVLFVPVNPASDPGGDRVAQSVIRVRRLAAARSVL